MAFQLRALNGLGSTPLIPVVGTFTWVPPDTTPSGTNPAPTSTPGQTAQQNTTPSTTVITTAPSKPWYTKWWAIGLLGVGAFAGYKAFKK